jgi:hypothetical protein
LFGGELIDRLENIAANVADRQYLNTRPLRQLSHSSDVLTCWYPEIKLRPPSLATSAAYVVIVLFIYIYLFVLGLGCACPAADVTGSNRNFYLDC